MTKGMMDWGTEWTNVMDIMTMTFKVKTRVRLRLVRRSNWFAGQPYSHSSTLKLPGREDFHELSDFCNLFC